MTAPGTPTQDGLLALLPRLRRYARVLTTDLHRADELVLQAVSLAAGRQSPPAPWPQLRHWLFAVIHRLHRDALAREARKPRQERPRSVKLHDWPDTNQMLARLSRLPAEQREVLALVVLEGLLYTEIADVLEVPVGTVMSRLHIAREAIRSMTAESGAPRPPSQ
jgi:RNA polymerase sigma-70 factor, ECF subfamily